MFGPIKDEENKKLEDLSRREKLVLAPLIVAIFAMGIFPNFFSLASSLQWIGS